MHQAPRALARVLLRGEENVEVARVLEVEHDPDPVVVAPSSCPVHHHGAGVEDARQLGLGDGHSGGAVD